MSGVNLFRNGWCLGMAWPPQEVGLGGGPAPTPALTPGRGMRAERHKVGPIAVSPGDFALRTSARIKSGQAEYSRANTHVTCTPLKKVTLGRGGVRNPRARAQSARLYAVRPTFLYREYHGAVISNWRSPGLAEISKEVFKDDFAMGC